MISKVKLLHWRSHLHSELKFSAGTNVLIGSLGSGKTSIMDAICFALFGTFPALQARKLKLDDVIMRKPLAGQRAEVECWFELDGESYCVKRVVEKGKGTLYSEFRKNGQVIEAPSTKRVTELVESTLRVNYELFSRAIYAEQNALDYFLALGKGQRMQKIDNLLALDKFEVARARATSLINKLLERKLALQTLLASSNLNELKKMFQELENSLRALESERNSMLLRLAEVKRSATELQAQLIALKKIWQALEELSKRREAVLAALRELEQSIKGAIELEENSLLSQLQRVEAELQAVSMQLKHKREQCESWTAKLSELRTRLEMVQQRATQLSLKLEEKERLKAAVEEIQRLGVEAQLSSLKRELEELVSKIEVCKFRLREVEIAIAQLNSAKSKCPVCETELAEERRAWLLEKKQAERSNLRQALEELERVREASDKQVEELNPLYSKLQEALQALKDLEQLRSEFQTLQTLVNELGQQALQAEEELKQVRQATIELEGLYNSKSKLKQEVERDLQRASELKEKKERLEQLKLEAEQLRVSANNLKQQLGDKDPDVLEASLRFLLQEQSELEGKLSGIERIVAERRERVEEFNKRIEELRRTQAEVERLDELIKQLRLFSQALQATQLELRKEFVEAVNRALARLWKTLYPYEDFVSARLSVEEGDYMLQLQSKDGNWLNVEGIASGGERSIACLALRIAFSLVLVPHLQWLILDEPTANLDSKALSQLAYTLRERAKEFVKQIFLITHQKELEESATGTLYMLERDKMLDGATRVIQVA